MPTPQRSGQPSDLRVAVVGGGVSGIRAALTLARAGCRVTLFEKNRHLGGRVFSFQTPDFGEVDIGQHIWLRACTAVEELLRDLGVPDDWVYRQDRLSMPYRRSDGTVHVLAAGCLPGALALLASLLRTPGLGFLEKLGYLRAMTRASLYSSRQIEALDKVCFADWLGRQRQSKAVVEWFWEPFIKGVRNGQLAEVSAGVALALMRETLLRSPEASAICLLRRPLSAVFDRLARQTLQRAGAEVCPETSISAIHSGTPVRLATGAGETRDFDRVILALPLKRMVALLPDAGLPTPPEEGAIVGLLVRFARPVMDELFFTAVGSPVQHVFNKSAIWNRHTDDGAQVIELVLSAAEREMKLGTEALAAELLPALARHLPSIRGVPVLAKRILPHGTATFRVPPGGETQRVPLTRPGLANIVFAGDYAATGLPSTMESAARAGQAAARSILTPTPAVEAVSQP